MDDMKESDLNRIINKTFQKTGFSHKIADPMHGTGIQNPFDGFSVFNASSWYWESKLSKNYGAFNFKRIEQHQLENLLLIKKELPQSHCLIILGVYEPRKYFDIFLFDIGMINSLMLANKKSFLKKELLELKNHNLHITLYRDKELKDYTFDCTDISSKVINLCDLKIFLPSIPLLI